MLVATPRRLFPTLMLSSIALMLYGYRQWLISGTTDVAASLLDRMPNPVPNLIPDRVPDNAQTQKHLNPFRPGTPKTAGSKYTKSLIVAKTKSEDTQWINEHFSSHDSDIRPMVYIADDPTAPLHPPQNKGHEVMIYLTYIIDHYENLTDVNIFMHAHRYTWHNNDLLDNDAVQMLTRLSAERVQREGYMNLRCSWEPGCPNWMHPGTLEENGNKPEEKHIRKAWAELFPLDPVPLTLAQPCCAQFALSRDRITALPKDKYIFYRDWMLHTPLDDYISGRVWEYVWQYLFTGEAIVCAQEHICYCDGYGVCFGGADEYQNWQSKLTDKRHFEDELRRWNELDDKIRLATEEGKISEAEKMAKPEQGKDVELQDTIAKLEAWLGAEKDIAKKRGDAAKSRALEAGRPWPDGDGF